MLKTQPLVKNETEKKLLQDLSEQGEAAGATLKQLQQVQQMHTTYKNLWSQLLVCRRSNLMSLIPLTSQRLEQLSVTAASLSSVLQGQLAPLQPLVDRLAVFASAHKSTAEELQAAGAAQALAAEKLALSQMESQVIDSLTRLIEASRKHTQEAAAAAAQLPPPPLQQRQQRPSQQQQLRPQQQSISQLFAHQGSPSLSGRSGPQQQQHQQQVPVVPSLQAGLPPHQQPSPASVKVASAVTPSGAFSLPDLPPDQMQQLLRILDGQTHMVHQQQQQQQQSSQGGIVHGVSSSRPELGNGVVPVNQQVAQATQQQQSLLQQQQQQQLPPPPMQQQQQQQHNRVEQQANAVPAQLQNLGRMRQLTQQLQQGKQHEQQRKRKQGQKQQQHQQHQQRHQQVDSEIQGSLQHKRRRLVDGDFAHIGGPQLCAVTTEPPMGQHRPPACAQQRPLQPQQQLLVQQHKQQQMGWQQELQHNPQQQQQQHGASGVPAGPLSLGLLAARSNNSNLQQNGQELGRLTGEQQQHQQQQWGQAGMPLPALPSQLLKDTWGAPPAQHPQTAALEPLQGLGQPLQPLTSALQQQHQQGQQHPPLQPLTAALQQQQRPDRAALVQSLLAAAATAATKSAEQGQKAGTMPVHVRTQQVLAMLQQQQEQQQQQQQQPGQNQQIAEALQHLEVQRSAQPPEQQQACALTPPPPPHQQQQPQEQQQQACPLTPQPPPQQQQQHELSPRQLQQRHTSEGSAGTGLDFLDAIKAQLKGTGTAGAAHAVSASPEPIQQPSHWHAPGPRALSEPAGGAGAAGPSAVPAGASGGRSAVTGPVALPAAQPAGGQGEPQQQQQQQQQGAGGLDHTLQVPGAAGGSSNVPMTAADAPDAAPALTSAAAPVMGPQQQLAVTATGSKPGLAARSVTAPQDPAQAQQQPHCELGQATAGSDVGHCTAHNGPAAAQTKA